MAAPLESALLLATTILVGTLFAQPASVTAVPQPLAGPKIFDAAGNLYAFSFGPVTPGAAQTENGGGTCLASNGFFSFPGPCTDAYVAKIDPSGNLVFGTYLGGSTADQSTAVAADGTGNIFVTGSTGGAFPTTTNAAIPTSTTAKVFAAKLSADGSRVIYSTYLPDTAATSSALAIDAQGNAYIAGKSNTGHAFVIKLNAEGSAFPYNVSLGGTRQDGATAIAADAAGNVTVAGVTNSPDFAVSAGAVQRRLNGTQNLFIARLDAGGRVVFSTYLGGSGTDTPAAVRTDSAGNVYVAGQTSSFDFPITSGSFQPAPLVPLWNNTGPGGFVSKLSAVGSALSWSTYVMSMDHVLLNGALQTGVAQLVVTASGETYIAGLTGAGFPVTPSAPQPCYQGPYADPFVARLDLHGALLDATYAGQTGSPTSALSLTADGSILLAAGGVRSQLRFGGPVSTATACLSPTILNSATLSAPAGPGVVPGELMTLTGFAIGPDVGVAYQPGAQGQVPRELAGVQVLFDGKPAPVFYSQSRQINVLAPAELSGQTKTDITVTYRQATVGSLSSTVVAYGSPGIFRLQPGVSTQAAALNQDGTLNTPANPAARGSVVSVWGTGFGLTDPPCATGGLNAPGSVNLAPDLSVSIADGSPPGVPVVYAPALYAGSAPALPCGVSQINFLVPIHLTPGVYPFFPWSLMALGGGAQSAAMGSIGVTISVK
jgi:uncharacterized protein (TIGR03437 family)